MKAKAGKPNAGRKAGDEGLPYSDADKCVGGPVSGQIQGPTLGEGSFGIKSNEKTPSQPKE